MTDQTAEAVTHLGMLTAMARAHMNVRRAQGYAFDFDNLLPSEEGEYLAAMQAALEASALLADRERLRLVVEKYRAALIDHHQWHLIQTDEDEHGIVPSDAYAESLMCDRTVDALQESAPDPINEAALNTQGEG